ncbi:MAG: Two component transcriptional regulator, winged helix family [Parcubacteria group bacterium GW2011_GWF2_44_8]|nr:MAG: Two component transcriptional regulator, winged helix family [Parcubacteria group bacterium GW2011_GWF2_44_8]
MKILVVEDNQKISKYIKSMLQDEAYVVDQAFDGVTALRLILAGGYDLVILDIMLPEKDGVSVCTEARAAGVLIPILMLTAKGELGDKIIGLDSGADDYLVKPFAMEELLARIRSLLRRPQQLQNEVLKVQDITLSTATHVVTHRGEVVPLTVKEYAVLEYLMRNAGVIVTREQMLEHCWDFAYSAFSNITDVYIKQLRQKLGNGNETYIKTIRGVGYLFQTE